MNIPINLERYAAKKESERLEEELKQLLSCQINTDIVARYQIAFDAAIDAHMTGKVRRRDDALLPHLELMGLIPASVCS